MFNTSLYGTRQMKMYLDNYQEIYDGKLVNGNILKDEIVKLINTSEPNEIGELTEVSFYSLSEAPDNALDVYPNVKGLIIRNDLNYDLYNIMNADILVTAESIG